MITIIETGVTHFFVSLDYAKKLVLKFSFMDGNMIVDTSTLGLIITSWVCLNCLLTIYGKSFSMDLVCLPLRNQCYPWNELVGVKSSVYQLF